MWKDIWVLMLVLSFVMLVISIILMYVWDIPKLVDELSGRKAKRQIKMLQELNSSTSTFDRLSTNEIYSGISSGTLVNEELSNIYKEKTERYIHDIPPISSLEVFNSDLATLSKVNALEDNEEATSFLNNEDGEPTSFLNNEDDESTSFLGDIDEESTSFLNEDIIENSLEELSIVLLEEQSSL